MGHIRQEQKGKPIDLYFHARDIQRIVLMRHFICHGCGECCRRIERITVSRQEAERLVRMFRFLEERFGLIAGEQILRIGELYYIQSIMGQDVTPYLLQISCEFSEMMKAAREAGFEVVAPAPGGKLRLVI